MARILFSALEPRTAQQLANILTRDGHEVQREKSDVSIKQMLNADIVFVGGEPDQYLPVLRRVRGIDSALCFVVVARVPETSEWLEALEAGATDYWATPFDLRQVRSLIASAVGSRASAATV